MKVIYGLGRDRLPFKKVVATIGVFDGIHIGHQRIIQKTIFFTQRQEAKSLVITFWPHPIKVLKHKSHVLILTSLKHRINLIQNLGPDFCLIIRFTKRFSNLEPKEFIKYLIKKINIKRIVVGEDFVFGKDIKGDVGLLKKLGRTIGFSVTVVPEFKIRGQPARSDFIRKLIRNGDIKRAGAYLNRDVSVYGKVVKGDLRGRILGYPTANIKTYQEIIPPRGVYLTRIILGKNIFFGICNIGKRPTFADTEGIVIEVHIFDFKKNIYGRNIEIVFLEKIRNEKKFANRGGLIERIKKDELIAKRILNEKFLP